MNFKKGTKGFTLIELLIVITIIGILAVAFLPSLLNAPVKARDTQRVAAISTVQEALMFGSLNSVSFPSTAADVAGQCATAAIINTTVIANMGGAVPLDSSGPRTAPDVTAAVAGALKTCVGSGEYLYISNPNNTGTIPSGTYSFGLFALVEQESQANAKCSDAYNGVFSAVPTANPEEWCYAVLTQ
ncbi:prepilin-type N-terminal cleavage/methylation domain-containing protein [Candidatus Gracilibacteria bacterium]|nr:prepilin-type N-terminal cleavage/methylation domain-containing protein [Candidatus Gracilibacteria bacterium]